MLRKTRIILAAVFYVLITLMFLDFTGTLRFWLGWTAKIQFLPAVLALNVLVVLALIVLTLIFGRIYCSVICPLGVMQDIIARLGRRGRRNKYSYSPEKKWLRYAMLAFMVVTLVAGLVPLAALIAPYSSYGRMAANLLQPIYIGINNLLAMAAEHFDSYAFYERDVWVRSWPTFVVAAVSFIVIAVLAWRGGRTYCNTICPVGTVLGFLSRFSWLKIRFDESKCTSCRLCERNCKSACIDVKNHKIDYSRCVACGDCLGKCKFHAISYTTRKPKPAVAKAAKAEGGAKVDTSKRAFLLGAVTAAASAAIAEEKVKLDGGLAKIEKKVSPERQTRITPPGSLSARHMAQHCTACQLCVAECPNDVLRPSTKLDTFMQPEMSYERGYCRPECTRCSEVCPTGAIKLTTSAEKTAIHIGHAVWIRKNCVPITDGQACGNCARHCPVGAITMVPLYPEAQEEEHKDEKKASLKIPVVNEEMCIGCGACENLCPSRPFPAIYVEGHEVHRRR